jgi:RNA 2',3'-cyclic 3'-phosphodiesterase
MLRLFIALPVPDQVAVQIGQVQCGLEGAKWSPRENLHVTLRFIGNCDEPKAEEIDAAMAQITCAPFDISLKGAGFFGSDAPHAAWLGVSQNDALFSLQKKCEKACRLVGLEPDPRKYTPHATLCYLPRYQTLEPVLLYQQDHALFVSDTWVADRFYLYSSATFGAGPSRFTIEAEYPLRE